MAKTIKIIRCTVCGSGTDQIDTDSKNYFKCKACGFEWEVINIVDKESAEQLTDLIHNPPEPNEDLKKLLKSETENDKDNVISSAATATNSSYKKNKSKNKKGVGSNEN